jgi:hypothetical protein
MRSPPRQRQQARRHGPAHANAGPHQTVRRSLSVTSGGFPPAAGSVLFAVTPITLHTRNNSDGDAR